MNEFLVIAEELKNMIIDFLLRLLDALHVIAIESINHIVVRKIDLN